MTGKILKTAAAMFAATTVLATAQAADLIRMLAITFEENKPAGSGFTEEALLSVV